MPASVTLPAAPAPQAQAEPPVVPARRPLIHVLDSIDLSARLSRLVPLLLVVAALWWGQAVIIPLVFSILIAYALDPAVVRLQSWHVPRSAGVPLVLFALIGSIAGASFALRGEAMAFVGRLPAAAHKIALAMERRAENGPGIVDKMQAAASELEHSASGKPPSAPDDATPVRVEEPTFKWGLWLQESSTSAANLAVSAFAVACLVYYLLAAGDMYKRKIVHIVGPSLSQKKTSVQILAEIERQVARFIWARVFLSAIVGTAVWIQFSLFHLEDAAIWGVLSTVLFAIPVAGPLLVVAGAGLAAFVQFGTMGMAAAVAGVTALIAAIEGNVLTPLLMRRVGEMNAVAVFVSLLFWGWIWGIWGLILAVPITAALKAVSERVESFEALAELLKE